MGGKRGAGLELAIGGARGNCAGTAQFTPLPEGLPMVAASNWVAPTLRTTPVVLVLVCTVLCMVWPTLYSHSESVHPQGIRYRAEDGLGLGIGLGITKGPGVGCL